MKKEKMITWEEFDSLCVLLANKLSAGFTEANVIITSPRGGLFVAGMLGYLLHIKDTRSLFKFNQEYTRVYFCMSDKVLFCDTLFDSGATAATSLKAFRGDAPVVKTAALFVKALSEQKPDFYLEELPADVWVVFPWEKHE